MEKPTTCDFAFWVAYAANYRPPNIPRVELLTRRSYDHGTCTAPAERASFTHPNGACFKYTTIIVFEWCFAQWRYHLTNHQPRVRILSTLHIPYSPKYWRALNLAVEPKIAISRILADLNLAVRYGIAIRIYASRKIWRL